MRLALHTRVGRMLLASVALLALAGGIAYAQIPDTNGVIHGGMLRAIKPALEIYASRQGGAV